MSKEHRGRLLVAARGVAAAQLLHAGRGAGWQSAAVYADPDFDSLPVQQADFAVAVPGNTVAETYADPAAIVAAAVRAECQAIHPGFGQLRQNPRLYELAQTAGIAVLWQGTASQPPGSFGVAGGAVAAPSYTGVAFVYGADVRVLGVAQNLLRVQQEVLLAMSAADFDAAQLEALRTAVALRCAAQQLTGFVTFDFEGGVAAAELQISQVTAGLPAIHRVFSVALGVDLLPLSLQEPEIAWRELAAVPVSGFAGAVQQRQVAVTCSVLAADPSLGFAPQWGELVAVTAPAGPGTWWEPGYAGGDEVSWDFDAVLVAVTVLGADHAAAWRKLAAALRGAVLHGVPTTAAATAALAAELALATEPQVVAVGGSQTADLLLRLQQLATAQPRAVQRQQRVLVRDTVRAAGREFTVGLRGDVTPATFAAIAAIAATNA